MSSGRLDNFIKNLLALFNLGSYEQNVENDITYEMFENFTSIDHSSLFFMHATSFCIDSLLTR